MPTLDHTELTLSLGSLLPAHLASWLRPLVLYNTQSTVEITHFTNAQKHDTHGFGSKTLGHAN